jgi:ankyrin repeat protein
MDSLIHFHSNFILAIKENDFEAFKELLPFIQNLNEVDQIGNTPLHNVLVHGRPEMIPLLLDRGSDPNHPNEIGKTPMLLGVGMGKLDIVKLLYSYGGSLTQGDINEDSPLHYAVERDYIEIVEWLVMHGVSTEIENTQKSTPLHLGIDSYNSLTYLLEQGANPNSQDNLGWTALHFAAHANEVEIGKKLMRWGADIHLCNFKGETPLDTARQYQNHEMVNFLIKMQFLGKHHSLL